MDTAESAPIDPGPRPLTSLDIRMLALDCAIQARPIAINGEKPSLVELAREFESYLRPSTEEPVGSWGYTVLRIEGSTAEICTDYAYEREIADHELRQVEKAYPDRRYVVVRLIEPGD